MDDVELEEFRAQPGTLEQGHWKRVAWTQPLDECLPCWFLANASETDRTQEVKLVCRSLVGLEMQLKQDRCATSAKLRKEWERRIDNNETAVNVLLGNLQLWYHVNGPRPERLYRPSEADLANARTSAAALRRMIAAHGEQDDGLQAFAEEVCQAADSIKQVSWEAIRLERFSLTPFALYGELIRTAQCYLEREDEEAERRKAFLAAPVGTNEDADAAETEDDEGEMEEENEGEGDEDDAEPALPGRGADKYDLNIAAEFRTVRQKKRNWQLAVKQAGLVNIDEMRTLLDLWYDELHLKKWRENEENLNKRFQQRKSEFKVFASVAYTHKRKPNVHVALPQRVKDVLLSPYDEKDWDKLEAVRGAIAREIEGEQDFCFDRREIESIASRIAACTSTKFYDELARCSCDPERKCTCLPEGAWYWYCIVLWWLPRGSIGIGIVFYWLQTGSIGIGCIVFAADRRACSR